MQWLLDNWVVVLFGGGMIAMHLFGHGHGGHGRSKAAAKADPVTPDDPSPAERGTESNRET